MGMFMNRDRCDYRCWNDNHLLEEARYNPNSELAIVLAERLGAELRSWKAVEQEGWGWDG